MPREKGQVLTASLKARVGACHISGRGEGSGEIIPEKAHFLGSIIGQDIKEGI